MCVCVCEPSLCQFNAQGLTFQGYLETGEFRTKLLKITHPSYRALYFSFWCQVVALKLIFTKNIYNIYNIYI